MIRFAGERAGGFERDAPRDHQKLPGTTDRSRIATKRQWRRTKRGRATFTTARWGDLRFQQPGLDWGQRAGVLGGREQRYLLSEAILVPRFIRAKSREFLLLPSQIAIILRSRDQDSSANYVIPNHFCNLR
jgi:hypothetical protein